MVFQCFRQRHVSNAMTNCGLYRNMPKACPYVMMQCADYTPSLIVVAFCDFFVKFWRGEGRKFVENLPIFLKMGNFILYIQT